MAGVKEWKLELWFKNSHRKVEGCNNKFESNGKFRKRKKEVRQEGEEATGLMWPKMKGIRRREDKGSGAKKKSE